MFTYTEIEHYGVHSPKTVHRGVHYRWQPGPVQQTDVPPAAIGKLSTPTGHTASIIEALHGEGEITLRASGRVGVVGGGRWAGEHVGRWAGGRVGG